MTNTPYIYDEEHESSALTSPSIGSFGAFYQNEDDPFGIYPLINISED